ncbi:MAG: SpoIID/LytB domain-containing protein [Cyanobacteria bacterium M_surface_10_m2_119]|nr:SpoIID/LytB domain-containing protein [Cyanobacteria bacterium M_surface_10_m2_119]
MGLWRMLPRQPQWQAPLPLRPVLLPLAAVVVVGSLLAPAAVAPVFAAGTEVRVLLLEAPEVPVAALDRPLQIRTQAPAAGAPGEALLTVPAGEQATLRLEQGRLQLETAAGSRSLALPPVLWIEPLAPAPLSTSGDFLLQQRAYRGRLQLRLSGATWQAINHLPLESYLPSVVGSEMPASWPQAALRAQAVAARTYALRQRRPSAPYDLSATVKSQVYKGLEAETPSTREAVAATRGQVLTYGGALANTVFHSSAGGVTENSGDLWSQQLPYLVSVPDFDQQSPVHQWQKRLEPDQLQQAFVETGGVDRIEVLGTTASGRLRQVRVQGPSGSLLLTGAQLRTRLGLRSTLVRLQLVQPEIASGAVLASAESQVPAGATVAVPAVGALGAALNGVAPPPPVPVLEQQPPLQVPRPSLLVIGRGFGHGVGMSQWGALAMAQRGHSHAEILSHYYRGTRLSLDGGR